MAVAVQHMVTGDGFLSVAFGSYIYLHLGIFNQVRDDQVMVFLRAAFYYGNVRTLGDGRVPVRLQCFLHPLVLGKHHQSRSIPVEPVEDKNLAPGIILLDVIAEQMISGTFLYTVAGNGHEPAFLIDNDQVVIFPDNM